MNVDHEFSDGWDEDTYYEIQCYECEKMFGYTMSISFYYEPHIVKCFETGEHEYKETQRQTLQSKKIIIHERCIHCDDSKTKWIDIEEPAPRGERGTE
jgi:hypothetical protein